MNFSARRRNVVIKQWIRNIGENQYQFNVTYWPDDNEVNYSVGVRVIGKGHVEIHRWRLKDGVLKGTYRRSHM